MKITLKRLEKLGACRNSRIKFSELNKKSIEIKDVFKLLLKEPYDIIVNDDKENKLKWANWLISKLLTKKDCIRYAIFAAERVIDIFENKYPNDDRPRKAIEAAKKYLKNPTEKNRNAAYAAYAAYAANAAAYAAYAAANAAAYAAYAAAYAADAAAYAAANAAANAAYAAANAAYAANATDAADMKIKIIKYGIKLLNKTRS